MLSAKEMIPINNLNHVRHIYIENQVLDFHNNFNINFPIKINDIINLINQISNARILSYQKFAEINNCSVDDVISLCSSASGCTHYDKINNRYLILYNASTDFNNVNGRILWTLAHELGHVKAGHLPIISNSALQIAENGFNNLTNPILESEADYFAATLLAPFQLFEVLNINSVADIQNTFGLSAQASFYRWKKYLKWKNHHFKTAFDNKIIKAYKNNQGNAI